MTLTIIMNGKLFNFFLHHFFVSNWFLLRLWFCFEDVVNIIVRFIYPGHGLVFVCVTMTVNKAFKQSKNTKYNQIKEEQKFFLSRLFR